MKTKIARKGTKKIANEGKTTQAKESAKRVPAPPPAVEFKESTLQTMGFGGRGQTVAHETEKNLQRIGKMLHKRGLIADPLDWWLRTPAAEVVRFTCAGREFVIHVEGYIPQEGRWQVSYTQGPSDEERQAEERAKELEDGLLAASADSGISIDKLRTMCLRAGLEQFQGEGIKVKGPAPGQPEAVKLLPLAQLFRLADVARKQGFASPGAFARDAIIAAMNNAEDGMGILRIPEWIEQRIIETAGAANIKGGPLRLMEVELGMLVSDAAECWHQGILDGWNYKPAEKAKAGKDLAKLRRKWAKSG